MGYWLIKSEPEEYSYEMLAKDGKASWTGVRGFQAMKNLRTMKAGDTAFFYHTGKEKSVVGICTITKEHFPDPTAEEPMWVAVEIARVRPVKRPVSLAEVKADSLLSKTPLARDPRLSVQPFTDQEYAYLLAMTEKSGPPPAGSAPKMRSTKASTTASGKKKPEKMAPPKKMAKQAAPRKGAKSAGGKKSAGAKKSSSPAARRKK